MISLAIIGTNWITEKFVNAAIETKQFQLTAVYSRTLLSAQAFAAKFNVDHCFDDLHKLANDKSIDAVYIASPNSFHFPQAMQMLQAGKHVICEKPLACSLKQAEELYQTARDHNVILFEAYMTAHLPNFKQIKDSLPKLGQLRKVHLNFCQYSSRYPAYLAGNNPNTFLPEFGNGSIMDIGYYCVSFSVFMFGKPESVQASAYLLETGVDGCGTVILNYGSFSVTIDHSKVSNAQTASEIQGEDGCIKIDHVALLDKVSLHSREQKTETNLSLAQNENSMFYEANYFAELIKNGEVDKSTIENSKVITGILEEIRKLTGVTFPDEIITEKFKEGL